MKRICHVTSVHAAHDTRIYYKECLSLSKKYEVFLLVANVEDEYNNGIKIIGCPLPKNRFRRIISAKTMIDKIVAVKADVYHFHDPELLPVGIKVKKITGSYIIFDSHEDVPMQILCKEYLPAIVKKPLSKIYSIYESIKMRKYDALVTVTPVIYERLLKINKKTYQITNYPVYRELPTPEPIANQICFTGGIAEQYQHHHIINCLDKTNATYVLAGIAYPEYLEEIKKLPNWNRVDYRGVVSYDEVLDIMRHSCLGMVILFYSPNVGYKRGTLGVLKMFEYMMAGIPIVATDFEIWKEIIDEYKCGIYVNPYSEKEITDAINYILSNPDKAKQMGANGRRAVNEKYNWSSQEKILFQLYKDLLEE